MDIYGTVNKAYTGSAPYPATPTFAPGVYSSLSANCADVQTGVTSFGVPMSVYPVDCDFITLTNTGTVFFEDPLSMTVTVALEVSTVNQNNEGYISYENMKTIVFVEVGFMIVAIIVLCIGEQLRKFKV